MSAAFCPGGLCANKLPDVNPIHRSNRPRARHRFIPLHLLAANPDSSKRLRPIGTILRTGALRVAVRRRPGRDWLRRLMYMTGGAADLRGPNPRGLDAALGEPTATPTAAGAAVSAVVADRLPTTHEATCVVAIKARSCSESRRAAGGIRQGTKLMADYDEET